MKKVKILLADKREIFREGMSMVLKSQPYFDVVHSCSSGFECVEKTRELNPDVVVLDTEIQDCNFAEAIAGIKSISPQSRIIMLTHSEKDQDLFSALKLGASAYLTKDIKIEDLVDDILRIHEGEVIVTQPLADKMLQEFATLEKMKESALAGKNYGLSNREIEVLSLVARGDTNKEIAEKLYISENTVKVHLSAILEKMHVKNRQQAAIFAVEKGFISEAPPLDT